ncbi:MAG TPA: pseudoazurin [Devosia sp.]|nr:pseudoazurin [Devosia sp.]
MKTVSFLIAGGLASLMMVIPAMAEDHQVQMLNKDSAGRAMQFEPAFLKIAPGDTVTFVPTDKGHNSESVLTLMPEAAEPWKGKISQEITVTFDTEGFFAYKCLPHLGMGMIGLIQVGDAPAALDPAQVKKLPKRAADRLTELTAEAGEAGADATSPPEAPAAQ